MERRERSERGGEGEGKYISVVVRSAFICMKRKRYRYEYHVNILSIIVYILLLGTLIILLL